MTDGPTYTSTLAELVRELILGCGMRSTPQGEVMTTNPLRPHLLHELTEALAQEDGWLTGATFPGAMRAVLGARRHATRSAWSAGWYVTAQAGYPAGIGVNANTAAATGLAEGELAVFGPYLMRCQPQVGPRGDDGRVVDVPPTFEPWTPTQEDVFASDWQVVPRRPGASSTGS